MIGLDELSGQDQPVGILRRALDNERVPHGMLFQGPEGVGKATAALAFAAELIAGEPVGSNHPLASRFAGRGNHMDLMTVRLEAKKSVPASRRDNPTDEDLAKFITVDQIRRLSSLAASAPREGRRRVFLIDPADRMNPAAQNALLKTLEEPPGSAVLILVASRPHHLLPTVRSRCFQLRFSVLKSGELAALLERRGVPPAEAGLRAALAEGRPGYALELDLESLRERREELLARLEGLASSPRAIAGIASSAAVMAGKDDKTLQSGLDMVQSLLRDASRAASGDLELIHIDCQDRLKALGDRLTPARAACLVAGIDRLRGDLRFNVNRTLIAETVLAGVAGAPIPTR